MGYSTNKGNRMKEESANTLVQTKIQCLDAENQNGRCYNSNVLSSESNIETVTDKCDDQTMVERVRFVKL